MCALELDSLQVRRDEKSSLQMDLETAGFLKICNCKIGSLQMGFDEACIFQMSTGKNTTL